MNKVLSTICVLTVVNSFNCSLDLHFLKFKKHITLALHDILITNIHN